MFFVQPIDEVRQKKSVKNVMNIFFIIDFIILIGKCKLKFVSFEGVHPAKLSSLVTRSLPSSTLL